MLPAPFRLSSPLDFATVLKGESYGSLQAISIKWRSTHLSQPKVGFIASKKNFPKAIDRNRAKRLLREAMRAELFQLKPGFAIIVLYRYKPDHLSLEILTQNIHALLKKNNLLQKTS